MTPLPLTDVATGAWSNSATAVSDGPASAQPEPGVDSHPAAAILQVADDPLIGLFVEGNGVGGRRRLVVVPDFHEERIGDQDADRSGLSRAGDPEGLEDGSGNLRLVADRDQRLDDGRSKASLARPCTWPIGAPGADRRR